MRPEEEIENLVERWRQSLLAGDVAVAAELRDDAYTAVLPDGSVLSKQEELARLAAGDYRVHSMDIDHLQVTVQGLTAFAVLDATMEGESTGGRTTTGIRLTIRFRKRDDQWRAAASRVEVGQRETPHRPMSLGARLLQKIREAAPSFEELAYVPYQPRSDYALPRGEVRGADPETARLPVPPRELWLGYDYPADGKRQVDAMLEIVRASDVAFTEGDRILDLGCGAGRMIRHLQTLAGMCEIWGTDISAEHILWCKRHLQPPFHFATTTKVPHLPFEDRSFRLIYCGSVFTHIDDLADAWLLELRRILTPDGRLYLTIHDEHTIEILDQYEEGPEWLRAVRASKVYRQSKRAFDMLTVGRGHNSQVFYSRDYLLQTVQSMFDVVSVTPEAYFAQTAVLLKRKAERCR